MEFLAETGTSHPPVSGMTGRYLSGIAVTDRHLRRMSLPAQTAAPRNLPTEARYGTKAFVTRVLSPVDPGCQHECPQSGGTGIQASTLLAVGLVVGLRREDGLNLATNHLSFR